MDNLGLINVLLGDYFEIPHKFEELFNENDSALKSTFNISLAPNEFQTLNFTSRLVRFTPSEIVGV